MIIILHNNNILREQGQEEWKVQVRCFIFFLFLFLVVDHIARHSLYKVDV